MERTSVRRSDRIITISGAMRDILVDGYGADPARLDIVHDGVDTGIFCPQDGADLRAAHAPGADHVLIFHGVIDPQDGPELLVEAAPAILAQHPRSRFWMVGDGTAVPGLKAAAGAAGLADHFFFSGWVRQADVARYISASDLGLVILPDVLSARGRVTLKEFEYWACGVPAVLPRLPALQEVVGDEAASLFYTPGDAADFATDADLADSPALVDLRTLRRRGQLAFKFSLASDRLWPRAYKYLIRRIAPNTAPGTPGLSSPYVRPHMVALLNTIATQFREASASQAPPLWINCITRTVTDQCRLQELGFSAHYPSAHCRGWAADVEVGWYERSGYRDTLVTILDRMRQAQHINAIDEGRIWHISPHPDFVAVH